MDASSLENAARRWAAAVLRLKLIALLCKRPVGNDGEILISSSLIDGSRWTGYFSHIHDLSSHRSLLLWVVHGRRPSARERRPSCNVRPACVPGFALRIG